MWQVNLDGSDARVLAVGDRRFRYPSWSPDGSVIANLGIPGENSHYDEAIYFTEIKSGQRQKLNLVPVLPAPLSTVNGPMTWSQ